MPERIAHYPKALTVPVIKIFQDPSYHGRIRRKGYRLNNVSETMSFNKRDLSPENAIWVSALLAPCIFISVIGKDAMGGLQEARAGHFSTRFVNHEIDQFLSKMQTPREKINIWITGMSQKTSHRSLKGTTERLVDRIIHFGIPLTLEWENEELPLLRDVRNDQLVSDIGLGLLKDKENDEDICRLVSLGITSSHSLFISTIYSRLTGDYYHTHVFTEDTGVITKEYTEE